MPSAGSLCAAQVTMSDLGSQLLRLNVLLYFKKMHLSVIVD